MTSEELRQKYRLLKVVAAEGVRSYQALDAGGHIVMVHQLLGDSAETARLLALLGALSPGDKRRVVEQLQVDGAPVLVTDLLLDFRTLPAWLHDRTQRSGATPVPSGPSRPAGELTGLFGPSGTEAPPRAPAPGRAPPPPPPPAASGGAVSGDATEVVGPPAPG